MSKNDAQRFTIDVFSQKELAERFMPVQAPKEIGQAIKDSGYDFTREELQEAIATMAANNTKIQLSDSMLDDVSGGGLWSGYKKISRGVCTRIIAFIKDVSHDEAREMIDDSFKKGVEDKVPQDVKDILDGLEEIVPIFK